MRGKRGTDGEKIADSREFESREARFSYFATSDCLIACMIAFLHRRARNYFSAGPHGGVACGRVVLSSVELGLALSKIDPRETPI